jgi:excinuclease ABC subunit A
MARVPAEERLFNEKKLQAFLKQEGFRRIFVPKPKAKMKWENGKPYASFDMGEVLELDDLAKKGVPKTLFYVVIDRMSFTREDQGRIVDSLAQAFAASLKFSKATTSPSAEVFTVDGKRLLLSEDNSCSVCGFRFPPITSALFSFNSPVGACSDCNGFGNKLDLDENKIIPDPEKTLNQGAIAPFAMPSAQDDRRQLKAFCKKAKIDSDTPWKRLTERQRKLIWDGTESFYGVKGLFEYLETKKYKMHIRVFLSRFKSPFTCPTCKGTRLKPEAQQVKVDGHSISELGSVTIEELAKKMSKLTLKPHEQQICAEPLRQIQ